MSESESEKTFTPNVCWAQRPKLIFITIDITDVAEPGFEVAI